MPESQLAVAQADASDPQLVTDAQHGAYLAVWSPDGSRLAYISQTGADTRTAELVVIEADGSNPHQLTHNEAWEYGVSWSPDGRRLSYGSEQGEHWQVWVVNADGSDAHPLPGTEQGNAPDWSPDGQSIVFTSDRTGNDNLYVVAANGGTARRLTTDACHSDNPRWSPDGNQIVYAVFCPNQWNDIAVISVDGSQSHRLTQTSNQEEEVPAWLPDNQHIGFARYQEEQDGLWPGPAFRALLFGLFLGLIVSGISVLRRLRKTTPKEETQNV
jgi:TolB protein